jgi:hypothetical protein
MQRTKGFVILGLLALLVLPMLSGCYANSTRTLGTPIPTQIPATPPQFASLPIREVVLASTPGRTVCKVKAVDLLGAWVTAGAPETDPFAFTDLSGDTCQGTFAEDIQPLFTLSNTWYPAAPPCTSCHYEDLTKAQAQLDLSSYAGILAGSRRASPEAKGNNILGMSDAGTDWSKAILSTQLTTFRMPPGHPAATQPAAGDQAGPVVPAGSK